MAEDSPDPMAWGIEEVVRWWESQQPRELFGRYANQFKDQFLDGEQLLRMSVPNLRDNIGVVNENHIAQIMKRIRALQVVQENAGCAQEQQNESNRTSLRPTTPISSPRRTSHAVVTRTFPNKPFFIADHDIYCGRDAFKGAWPVQVGEHVIICAESRKHGRNNWRATSARRVDLVRPLDPPPGLGLPSPQQRTSRPPHVRPSDTMSKSVSTLPSQPRQACLQPLDTDTQRSIVEKSRHQKAAAVATSRAVVSAVNGNACNVAVVSPSNTTAEMATHVWQYECPNRGWVSHGPSVAASLDTAYENKWSIEFSCTDSNNGQLTTYLFNPSTYGMMQINKNTADSQRLRWHEIEPATALEQTSLDQCPSDDMDGWTEVTHKKEKPNAARKQHQFEDDMLRFYKVEMCNRSVHDDFCDPMHAHSEHERRRDPLVYDAGVSRSDTYRYEAEDCPYGSHGCPNASSCGYSHNATEKMYHPQFYKTSLCKQYAKSGACKHGKYCAFAHSPNDMRRGSQNYSVVHSQDGRVAPRCSTSSICIAPPAKPLAASASISNLGQHNWSIPQFPTISESSYITAERESLVSAQLASEERAKAAALEIKALQDQAETAESQYLHREAAREKELQTLQDRIQAAEGREAQVHAMLEAEKLARKDDVMHRGASGVALIPSWQCHADGEWVDYPAHITAQLEAAYELNSDEAVPYTLGNFTYTLHATAMKQVNTKTRMSRQIQRVMKEPQRFPTHFEQPNHWAPMQDGQNCELVQCMVGSDEWCKVEQLLHKTLPEAKLEHVHRIQNISLWKLYCDQRQGMAFTNNGKLPKEVEVWHGTRATKPEKIYKDKKDGFMMQLSSQGMWGRGIYFAENASYSHAYAHQTGSNRQILLVNLLVGEAKELDPNRSIQVPPVKETLPDGSEIRYDTIKGVTGGSRVYIVYENKRAYPAYRVTYN